MPDRLFVLLVPLMFLMFALGSVVIVAGFAFDHVDFAAGLLAREGASVPAPPAATPTEAGRMRARFAPGPWEESDGAVSS